MTHDVSMAPDPVPRPGGATATRMHHEERRGLFLALAGPPVLWTVHLLATYLVVGLWCGAGWTGAGVAIAVLTAVCALATLGSGVLALRAWRVGQTALVHDEEAGEPEPWDGRMGERGARTSFLAVLALCMAALFGFLVLLQGLPVVLEPTCPATSYP